MAHSSVNFMAHSSVPSLAVSTFLAALHLSCFAAGADWPTSLFVFGGSYADTGNHNPFDPDASMTNSWRSPYGITWPGLPTGRYSDGRLSTDFLASFLGIRSPVPFREAVNDSYADTTNGVNFAYGGSGVFPTFSSEIPNITAQITEFQNTIIDSGVLPKANVSSSSLAFLVVGGNDYIEFNINHPSATEEASWEFVPVVVDGIADAVRRLYDLGFRKIAVTNLQPLGCQPGYASRLDYNACNEVANRKSQFHNELLSAHIYELEKLAGAEILTLDLYSSFMFALNQTGWSSAYEPCCQGISADSKCGDYSNGTAQFTVCSDPNQTFFWDDHHPTQAGWTEVVKALWSQFTFARLPSALPQSSIAPLI